MKIGIIGSGHIGSTLAKHFVAAGHEVAVSNSRGPDTLRGLESELGGHGHAVTTEEAERFGNVVVVSVPFKSYADVPADGLAGKIVIDTINYYPDRDGHFTELDSGDRTSSEMLAGRLPGARVVKAFNAIQWTSLRDKPAESAGGQRVGIRSRATTRRPSRSSPAWSKRSASSPSMPPARRGRPQAPAWNRRLHR